MEDTTWGNDPSDDWEDDDYDDWEDDFDTLDDFYVYGYDDDFDDWLDETAFDDDYGWDDIYDDEFDDAFDDDEDVNDLIITTPTTSVVPVGLFTVDEYKQKLKDGTNLTLKEKLDKVNADVSKNSAKIAELGSSLDYSAAERAAFIAASNAWYNSGARGGTPQAIARSEARIARDAKLQEWDDQRSALDNEQAQLAMSLSTIQAMYDGFTALNPNYESLETSEQQKLQLEYEFNYHKEQYRNYNDTYQEKLADYRTAKDAYDAELAVQQARIDAGQGVARYDADWHVGRDWKLDLYNAHVALQPVANQFNFFRSNLVESTNESQAYQIIQTEIAEEAAAEAQAEADRLAEIAAAEAEAEAQAEAQRLAAEAQVEAERLAAEAEAARIAAEEARLEAERIAEEERITEEERIAEEARIAEEQAAAEQLARDMDLTRDGQIDPSEGGWFFDENGEYLYQLPEMLVDGNDETYGQQNVDEYGLDYEGYDEDGYNVDGFDRDGLNTDGDTQEDIDRRAEEARIAEEERLAAEAETARIAAEEEAARIAAEEAANEARYGGLTPEEIAEGYYYGDDGILVIPELTVVADPIDDGSNAGPDLELDPIEDGGDDGNGDGDGNINIVPTPDSDDLYPFDQEKLTEISNRFRGTRRDYNDFLRSKEGEEAAKNLGDFINKNISPSGKFDMTKRIELLDKIAQIATDGDLTGLNAFALGVNLIEGITQTNLIDVPNVGYFVNNLTEKYLDEDILATIAQIVPDFIENLTGIDQILQANSTPSGYLGQGFDFATWLLGDLGMAREVDYGLLPATEQIRQQREDYFREFLGNDVYENFLATTPEDDPNFLQKIINFGQNAFGEVGDFAENLGFLQQKYFGGTLPANLLNLVGLSSLGLPIGSLANMLGGAMAPSGQDLSDYLYRMGIDPTTATRSDIGRFLVDQEYDVPGFNYETGEFEIQTDENGNELNTDTDGDGFFDIFIDNVASLAGDNTVAGEVVGSINNGVTGDGGIIDTIINATGDIVSGTGNTVVDIFTGVTQTEGGDGNNNNNEGGDGNNNNNNGNENETVVFSDTAEGTADQNVYGDGNTVILEVDDGNENNNNNSDGGGNNENNNNNSDGGGNSSVDAGDIITTGNMSDIDENAYDPAYETAKFILGASEAERFRGVGLGNEELQQIIGDYSSMVGESEAERLLELNRIEQTGINELRDVQKASDLDLLGSYGQEYANAVRGLDPTALGVLGEQKELSDRLYRRAAGDLTAEEEADAEERAFEVAASTGRTMDSTRIANVLRAEEDMIANLEGRAQQAGTSTYNMSRGLTGNIPAMLLGNTGNPYGTGIGQVTPPLGIGDVISIGRNSYAQQENISQAQAQLDSINRQYDQAVANNEPSKAQELLAQADQIMGYISLAGQGLEFIGNLPGTVRNVKDSFSNAVQGVKTLFGGGSSAPSYNPNSSFNVMPTTQFNTNDYLDLGSFGNTSSGGSGFQYDFGDFG